MKFNANDALKAAHRELRPLPRQLLRHYSPAMPTMYWKANELWMRRHVASFLEAEMKCGPAAKSNRRIYRGRIPTEFDWWAMMSFYLPWNWPGEPTWNMMTSSKYCHIWELNIEMMNYLAPLWQCRWPSDECTRPFAARNAQWCRT